MAHNDLFPEITVPRDGDAMLVIRGTVSILHVTDDTVNLLKGMQNKMAAVINDMAGSVANAAMVGVLKEKMCSISA